MPTTTYTDAQLNALANSEQLYAFVKWLTIEVGAEADYPDNSLMQQ